MSAPRGFYARTNALLRRAMFVVVLLAVGLLAAWLAAQNRVGDEIRAEVERRFASHYPGYRVTVRDARLVERQGIEIRGLSITRRPEIEPLVSIEELQVVCAVCFEDVLRGQTPPAERLVLRGVSVRARQDADGNWDIARLWPPPKFGDRMPPMVIRDSTLRLTSGKGDAARTWELRKVQLDASPEIDRQAASGRSAAAGSASVAASAASCSLPGDEPPAAPTASPALLRIRGQAAGDEFGVLEFEALVPPKGGPWRAWGSLVDLRLAPQLYESLPQPWRGRCGEIASLSGLATLSFQLRGDTSGSQALRSSGSGYLRQGQVADRRLPFRLNDAAAAFRWDDQRLSVERFTARNGAAELQLSLVRDGFAANSPWSLRVRAQRLSLDQRFLEVLPPHYQAKWRKYFPSGLIDADARIDFDGRQWHPEIHVECTDVSFAYHNFPYRLERAQGQVSLVDDVLTVDLTAMAGGQTVALDALVRHPGEQATGWLDVACERPIPIDEKLLDAVRDPRAKAVLTALRPGGTVAVAGRFERREAGGEIHRFVRFDIENGTMCYDAFPYPLGMIQGTILWEDQGWSFEKLSGRNDSGYIECQGSWTPSSAGGSVLALTFVCVDVPLEDELREALNPGAAQLWNELQPRGSIDNLQIALRYTSAPKDLSVQITAQKWGKRPHDEGRTITVYPAWFPYRLDDLKGQVVYRDGQLHLQGLSATHGETKISLDGQCQVVPDGPWTVELSRVVAERLNFDEELRSALPPELGRAVGKLAVRGNLSLQGALAFRGVAGDWQPAATGWDLAVDVENGSLNCGLELNHIHGDVRLVGNRQGQDFYSRGELNIDSLVYHDMQLTQLRGPLLIEPARVVFGAEAERDRTDAPPRSVVAQAVGGQISADAVVYFEDEIPFRLRAGLERGDLQLFARETALTNQNIRGKANALVNLSGTVHGRHTWQGDGFVRLYEADIYEVPVMLALLKLLSIRQPDRTAFTSSDIDFRIRGEHLYFDRINFNGDAISLKGHGDMSLNRQIDLKFYTLVGRRDWDPPALRALLQQAAQQLLLIHATGSLDQPHLTREPFPNVKETLEQLFPEVAARQDRRRAG